MGDPARIDEAVSAPSDEGGDAPVPGVPGDPSSEAVPSVPSGPLADPVAVIAARLADGGTLDVRADDPLAEAGRKVLRFHLARMLARVPGVIAGEDEEEVHAMRVAARRMRAAWRVFGDAFERGAVRRYRGELREIGATLGAVRDLDVLIGILEAHREGHGLRQRAGLEPLHAAWRAEREARRSDLVAVLTSDRFARFVTDYDTLVETPGRAAAVLPPHAPALVRNRVPATVWVAYQRVWAFDDALETADLAALHELRIAGKWLRYALEFVREPLGPESAALIKPIVALQDHLGSQHDLHVAGTLAREFAASGAPTAPQAKAIHKLATQLDTGVERLGRTLPSTWRPVVAPGYRRRLGRALARL